MKGPRTEGITVSALLAVPPDRVVPYLIPQHSSLSLPSHLLFLLYLDHDACKHHGSASTITKEITPKTHPKRGPSFISLGVRTKGLDKDPPARDCSYGIFRKRMQTSILGFGALATAIYSRDLISEAALHASRGSIPSKGEMRHFQQ